MMHNAKVGLIVAVTILLAVSVVLASGELAENEASGNSGGGFFCGGFHATGDSDEEKLYTLAMAGASAQPFVPGVMVSSEHWAYDGNIFHGDLGGYDLPSGGTWSVLFEMQGEAKVWVSPKAAKTNPPTTYWGEGWSILELTDIAGNVWQEWTDSDDAPVEIAQEFSMLREDTTSVFAGFSISTDFVDVLHIKYEARSYAEAECSRGETKVHAYAVGEVVPDLAGYVRLLDNDDGEIVDEWNLR